MLKNSMRQELEEFDLLPMNRADCRHSWTYSFVVSTEMQLPYLYVFCVTKFQDWDLVRLMRFYKFILLHLKSKKKISFQ